MKVGRDVADREAEAAYTVQVVLRGEMEELLHGSEVGARLLASSRLLKASWRQGKDGIESSLNDAAAIHQEMEAGRTD